MSELLALVKVTKSLELSLTGARTAATVDEGFLDQMLLKAFKMALRAVKFYDVWTNEVELEQIIYTDSILDQSASDVPPTPPADQTSFHAQEGSNQNSFQDAPSESGMTGPTSSAGFSDECSAREARARERQTEQGSRPSSHTPQPRGRSRTSQSFIQSSRPSSIRTAQLSTSHRVSWSGKTLSARSGKLASDRLITAHEAFLGFLVNFVGIHLSSRTSTEILVTTHQAVNAGRALLTVVEAVWDRGLCKSGKLEETRDNMYSKLTEMVHAAQNIFQPLAGSENQEFNPDDRKQLADAATACIRGAGACVASTRDVLELIGDFEFETIEEKSAFEGVDFTSKSDLIVAEENTIDTASSALQRQKPYPPEPTTQPPPPPSVSHGMSQLDTDLSSSKDMNSPSDMPTPPSGCPSTASLIPPAPSLSHSAVTQGDRSPMSISPSTHSADRCRVPSKTDSAGFVSIMSGSTFVGSMQDSDRGEGLEVHLETALEDSPSSAFSLNESFARSESTLGGEADDAEENGMLEKTYAHELLFNKDGQVSGGTLPALIERLTTHDSTPDALFVSTFYLTFRIFATPCNFAQALIDRFEYVGDSKRIAGPVRLRVYNVFKGWLESHWRLDCDNSALELINSFALNQLSTSLPSAGKRLFELAQKVSKSNSPLVPRLVSSIGKTNTSIAQYVAPDAPVASPNITKSQLGLLKAWKNGGSNPQIVDFDPLELARQLTLKVSRLFCSILPEELLGTEWTKKTGSIALNVRAMATLSTDLANLVAESVLQFEEHSKRAKIIKRWVKIGAKCLELNNYDSLMAIVCSLNSTTILRLKRTWECVSAKTKASLENLKSIVDCSRNYITLRQRLAQLMPPCLPFVGIYLTDLTFVDAGNQATRALPGASSPGSSAGAGTVQAINFDKHLKTAKIISEFQRFQIPYRIAEVPELQTWMQDQFVRVRACDEAGGESSVNKLYRRSCLLEPREQQPQQQQSAATAVLKSGGGPAVPALTVDLSSTRPVRREGDFMGIAWKY